MQVTLNYFAQVRKAVGAESEKLEIADGADVLSAVLKAADEHGEGFRGMLLNEAGEIQPSLLILVNGQPVPHGQKSSLADGDEISILSPVAGG
jgi:MoaD family protein